MNNLLDEIMKQLDPSQFYRANRQFIVARSAIKDITVWFGSRVVVNLNVDVPERIIISRTHVQDFKKWLTEVPIETVSKILGHADIKTTQIYAKVIDKSKREAVDKLDGLTD